jgi:hypothetical protein
MHSWNETHSYVLLVETSTIQAVEEHITEGHDSESWARFQKKKREREKSASSGALRACVTGLPEQIEQMIL